VILINMMLGAISIFCLSFLKIPTRVWNVTIQRRFLWGGVAGERKFLGLSGHTCIEPNFSNSRVKVLVSNFQVVGNLFG
jgi:hypothetical protein